MRKLYSRVSLLLCIVLAFGLFACNRNEPKQVTVYITEKTLTLEEGKSAKLGAVASNGAAVTFTSSKENVASVSDDGVITALAVGKTTVTVSVPSAMAQCEVTVTEAPEAPAPTITMSISSASLYIGDELTLSVVAPDGADVTYLSTDSSVASVTEDGKVKALSVGTTNIRARITGAIASCSVNVKALPSSGNQGGTTGGTTPDPDIDPDTPTVSGRTLVWSDEFNGTSLDTNKWGYQTGVQDNYNGNLGPWCWGNDEMQYYTQNAVKVNDGSLVITAKKESQQHGRTFTSGRILTRDKFSRTYGYFEARIKTPAISGMWPAFWMLPQPGPDAYSQGWAANGEIDIMEAKGRLQNKVDTTIHFGGQSGVQGEYNDYATKETTLSSSTDQWHTYAVDWRADAITWYIDGVEAYKCTNAEWWTTIPNATASAPFDKPFYIILNLACEGRYDPGATVPSGFTSAAMYVDYVRVYE